MHAYNEVATCINEPMSKTLLIMIWTVDKLYSPMNISHKMKQKKNTALYILIAAITAAFLLTTVLFIGIVNLHQNYSEYLIKCIYNSRPQATSTLIRAMLNDNYLDRYRLNEEYDHVSEAALSNGYTDNLPSYIRQKYVKKLMPYIVGYIAIMIVICGVIIYYFTVAKKKYEGES